MQKGAGLRYWLVRRLRKLRGTFRLRVLLPIGAVAALAVYLLAYATPQTFYLHSVSLEIGGDLVGAIIVIAILTPLLTRAREGRIRERGRLDYDVFTDHVASATSAVKVLDTHSALFDRPETQRTLAAFRRALGRQTRVQILLLHPNSTSAAVRSEETHRDTIRAEICSNIRVLSEFIGELPDVAARRFEVRLYATPASTTLYRWDDRALVSFLSFGRHNPGGHLEIDLGTSLGHFVEEHFTELWHEAMPIEAYLRLPASVTDNSDDGTQTFSSPYVWLDGTYYLADPQMIAHLVGMREGAAVTTVSARPDEQFQPQVVDHQDEQLRETLTAHFMEKYGDDNYGWSTQAFLYLVPAQREPESRRLRFGRRS